jgi:uncharacterized protein (TIGR03437 family)
MLRRTYFVLPVRKVLGFALALVGVWPAIAEAQSLSFFKTLPAGPPPWSAAAAVADATGIYIAESVTFLRKYDRDGVEIWSRALDEGLLIRSMATSAVGVYVGGLTRNYTSPGPHGTGSVESFIRLYDPQGNELWTRQFGFTGEQFNWSYVHAVAADASGAYLAGASYSGRYLRKYDARGAELWTRRFEYGAVYSPLILAAGPSGIYFGQNDGRTPFLRMYDASGTEIWTRPVTGEYFTGITANATGVYVIGFGASGLFLSRYDAGGNQIWVRGGIAGWIQRIAVDTDGIYAAGVTSGALPGQCAAGSFDAFVTRFDMDGKELWTRQFGTLLNEDVAGIAVDAGNIFVAGGQFAGGIQFPARPVDRAFLAKLEKAAVLASPSETRIRNECVVNVASGVGGAVSPGEIVRILGTAIGPLETVSGRSIDGRPVDTILAETRVLFGGVAAPLLEVSSRQVTAIAPNAVAVRASVELQVEYRGVRSNAVTLPVLQAHPGIFGLDSSGWGAVRNQDGTVNSPENPARRGSTVSIYGTGGGETDPVTVDGQIVGNSPPRLKTTVLVSFPETEETDYYVPPTAASYAGAVPGLVAGLLQVNVRVPEALPDGNWLLQLGFGDRSEAETQSLQIAVSGK